MRTRDWNVSRLAEACDVDVALASRWVAENGKRRVWPGPRSCEKIADALDVDPDVVVVLAGHRRPRSARAVIDAKRQVAQGDSVVRLRQLGNSDVGLC